MKVLILLPRFPYPLEKGDKLRAFHLLKHLARDHEIILVALSGSGPEPAHLKAVRPYCTAVYTLTAGNFRRAFNIFKAWLRGLPLQVGYYYNCHSAWQLKKIIRKHQPEHIFCQLLRVAEYVKHYDIPKTLDYQDVFSKGIERRFNNSPKWMLPVLKTEYKRLLRYEHKVFDIFDHKTIISIPDRELIPHPDRDKIVIIRNGVDFEYFSPQYTEKKYDLVFTGNMGYPPNVNAAMFLARKVLPILRETRPGIKIAFAGATPHKSIMDLQSDTVTVTGYVDDLREYYAKARIFIAPMQIGTGLQNKLLEAMAMRIPCITSQLANSALGASEGSEILVGNEPHDYAAHVLYLLDNPAKADELAENGYKFVKSNYSWEIEAGKLGDLFTSKP